jgi:hypothetical protein
MNGIDAMEWTGAGLGVVGWLGVRSLNNHEAQLIGFSVWVASALILCLWAVHEKKRGVLAVNAINAAMSLSALVALVL